MRTHFLPAFCAVLCFVSWPAPQSKDAKPTPLILEKNEGERRFVRGWPGHPNPKETFVLNIDPRNGGSQHMVLFTAELPAGKAIDPHTHAHADEILYLTGGTVRVRLGTTERQVHGGATIFIPSGTLISMNNIGKDNVGLVCIFSAPGFEDFMRATSAAEGEKNLPFTQADEDAVEKKYAHVVVYQ